MLVPENRSMDTENQRRSGKTIDPDHDDLTRRFPQEERIYRMRS